MDNESMTGHIDELLLAGDETTMRAAAEHAASCPSCAETLRAWNEISATAGTLRANWPSDTLWPRIERALRDDAQAGKRRYLLAIAATIAMTVGLAAAAWQLVQVRQDRAFDRAILRQSALDQVEQAEKAHLAAIEQLEKTAEARLDEPQTPLMVSYKEKLMLLDEAIADCEANIASNRQNAHLRRQLLTMYTEKQKTLQQVVREDSNGSNQ